MAFLKRKLEADEINNLKLDQYGIEERRIPSKAKGWDFAVSENGKEYFTQLLSSSFEMRDGNYWYLYFTRDKYCLLKVEAWGHVKINCRNHVKGKIVSSGLIAPEEMGDIQSKINEAMIVVSYNNEGVVFDPTM